MNDLCYIITGKVSRDMIGPLLQLYSDVPNKILSTWYDTEFEWLAAFYAHGFTIVLNTPPEVKTSANYQSTCAYNGCCKAEALGFKTCIRMRTDMFPYPIQHLTTRLQQNLTDKLLCLAGMSSEQPKLWYYLDALIMGRTELLLRFFTPQQKADDQRCAEIFWLEEYIGHSATEKSDVLEAFTFCGKQLQGQPLHCQWHEKGWELFQCYIRPSNNFIWYE
jgi:hypothetical protein